MLDIRLIRDNPGQIKTELQKVGFPAQDVDALLAADARRRKLQHDLDEMRARRTRESKELGRMEPAQREARRAEMRALGDQITAAERELAQAENEFTRQMLLVPNLPRPWVPAGEGESANSVVRSEGEPRKFDFTPAPHWELGEKLGIIDFERGVKLSGSRFYFLVGMGARLERALI